MNVRQEWCVALAKLVSPSFPQDAATALCDMLPAMQNLPDAVFNSDTLILVALVKRRQSVPAYDEIVNTLSAWRRTYLHEPLPRLSAPRTEGRAPPTATERASVSATVRSIVADLAARAMTDDPPVAILRDVSLTGTALADSRRRRGITPVSAS